jgi:hypothetical protein
MQSVHITTNVVSSNPTQAIQHYVIKFVSDLSMVFSGTPVSSTNKTYRHDITEILWNVALNIIDHKPTMIYVLREYMNRGGFHTREIPPYQILD